MRHVRQSIRLLNFDAVFTEQIAIYPLMRRNGDRSGVRTLSAFTWAADGTRLERILAVGASVLAPVELELTGRTSLLVRKTRSTQRYASGVPHQSLGSRERTPRSGNHLDANPNGIEQSGSPAPLRHLRRPINTTPILHAKAMFLIPKGSQRVAGGQRSATSAPRPHSTPRPRTGSQRGPENPGKSQRPSDVIANRDGKSQPADTVSALRASPKAHACCDRFSLLRTVRFRTLLHAVHQRCTGKPRLDLIGARPTSAGARLPTIGALCVRADSSFNKRKTPWITRRKSPGSHAPAVHTMGHKRSRRRAHQNADDLRPKDSRNWRQPDTLESHPSPPHRAPDIAVSAFREAPKPNHGL